MKLFSSLLLKILQIGIFDWMCLCIYKSRECQCMGRYEYVWECAHKIKVIVKIKRHFESVYNFMWILNWCNQQNMERSYIKYANNLFISRVVI